VLKKLNKLIFHLSRISIKIWY